MLATVFKLPPGRCLIWRDGVVKLGKYWTHPLRAPEHWNERQLAQELREKLAQVVESDMISDAPLGVALTKELDKRELQ